MLELRLHYRHRHGIPQLRLGNGPRFAFIVLALIMSGLLVLLLQAQVLVISLVVLALAGAAFEERWTYVPDRHQLSRWVGILGMGRHRFYEANHILSLHLELETRKGSQTVEFDEHGNALGLINNPQTLAERLFHPRYLALYLRHATKGRILMERHLLRPDDTLVDAARDFSYALQVSLD